MLVTGVTRNGRLAQVFSSCASHLESVTGFICLFRGLLQRFFVGF